MIAGVFEWPAQLLAWFYSLTSNYLVSIGLMAVVVMVLVTPLILKSTRGMLEMQRLAPEMRRLQQQYKGDRQKLNEEMMKLYQEHKVNPMASCLPLLAQMPVFIIMFRILMGLTYRPAGANLVVADAVLDAAGDTRPVGFLPRYLDHTSSLYQSLVRKEEMSAFGLDLSRSAAEMLGDNFARGLVYAAVVAVLGLLYFAQQRMVAARAAVSPTMSPGQQKLMQYLPVAFAVFQIFFLLGLVIYYIVQALLRIAQQFYITKRFYHGENSLGRQAQAASERARELAKQDGGGGGLFGQAKREATPATTKTDKTGKGGKAATPPTVRPSKRTTPPKNRPTPSSRPSGRPGSTRPGSGRKKPK
jgi:YidC/Oxa1 family membrane protein insertase